MTVRGGWVRIHRDTLNHPKVGLLSDRQFRAWSNCLLIADPKDGKLPPIDHISWHIRFSADETQQAIDHLIEVCLIDKTSDGLFMHDWCDWQPQRDSDSARPSAAEWREIRERIFARDDYTCKYCDERGKKLHCDHVVPVSRGGSNDDDNLVTSCQSCNMAKHAKIVTVEEWRAIRSAKK